MRENELMFGYYINGDAIKVTEYVLRRSDDLQEHAMRRYHCTQDRAKWLSEQAIEQFLQGLKDGTLSCSNITSTLRNYVCAAYKKQSNTEPFNENRLIKPDY
jgi:hypothetical protein